MELSPGAALGPYRLLERAGEGGMAEVWRGCGQSSPREWRGRCVSVVERQTP